MENNNLKITGLIPARYASTRFPGKALVKLLGKPMIQHTYERASQSKILTNLFVVTDDERITRTVHQFGGKSIMTSPEHQSGTDRLAEAVRNLDTDLVVNIQGDEPVITSEAIENVVGPLVENTEILMTTLAHRIKHPEDLQNPHMGKVVFNQEGWALYFSRSPLPWPTPNVNKEFLRQHKYYNTVGLYGYRREFLLMFASLTPTPLEQIERLEQLRALEHGYQIMVRQTEYVPLGVDVPEDIHKVEKRLMEEEVT